MSVKFCPNKNWGTIIELIKQMRKTRTAPVDDKGCHMCFDQNADEKVSLSLKDTKVPDTGFVDVVQSDQGWNHIRSYATTQKARAKCWFCLRARYRRPGASYTSSRFLQGKRKVYKKKAKYIKNVAEILRKDYDEDIPANIEELTQLPGVGPKMAYLTMKVAWKSVCGIAVDTHVFRISKRLGFVPPDTKTPERARMELEAWLPRCLSYNTENIGTKSINYWWDSANRYVHPSDLNAQSVRWKNYVPMPMRSVTFY